MIIIDGSKRKKYKVIDQILERAYAQKQAEISFQKEHEKNKKTHLEKILSSVNIPAEQKERFVNAYNNMIKPVSVDEMKSLKIINSGIKGFVLSYDKIKEAGKVSATKIQATDEKVKKALRGEIDVSK